MPGMPYALQTPSWPRRMNVQGQQPMRPTPATVAARPRPIMQGQPGAIPTTPQANPANNVQGGAMGQAIPGRSPSPTPSGSGPSPVPSASRFSLGGTVPGYDDGGDVGDLPSDGNADISTALDTVDSILDYGRQKSGLMGGDQVAGNIPARPGRQQDDTSSPADIRYPVGGGGGNKDFGQRKPLQIGMNDQDNQNANMANGGPVEKKNYDAGGDIENAISGGETDGALPDQAAPTEGAPQASNPTAPQAGGQGMSPDEVNLRSVHLAAQQGGKDTAWALMQHYRQKFGTYRNFAAAALNGSPQKPGDLNAAIQAANQAFPNVLDGTQVQFAPAQNGIQATVNKVGGNQPIAKTVLTPQQFGQLLQGKAGQYDNLMEHTTAGALRQVQGTGQQQQPDQQSQQFNKGGAVEFDDGGTTDDANTTDQQQGIPTVGSDETDVSGVTSGPQLNVPQMAGDMGKKIASYVLALGAMTPSEAAQWQFRASGKTTEGNAAQQSQGNSPGQANGAQAAPQGGPIAPPTTPQQPQGEFSGEGMFDKTGRPKIFGAPGSIEESAAQQYPWMSQNSQRIATIRAGRQQQAENELQGKKLDVQLAQGQMRGDTARAVAGMKAGWEDRRTQAQIQNNLNNIQDRQLRAKATNAINIAKGQMLGGEDPANVASGFEAATGMKLNQFITPEAFGLGQGNLGSAPQAPQAGTTIPTQIGAKFSHGGINYVIGPDGKIQRQ